MERKSRASLMKKSKNKGNPADNLEFPKNFKFDAFFYRSNVDETLVKAGKKKYLKINFLPMKLGRYECCVVLKDINVGEMEFRL